MSLFNKANAPDAARPSTSGEADSFSQRRVHDTLVPAEDRVLASLAAAGFVEDIAETVIQDYEGRAAAAQAVRNAVEFVPEPADMITSEGSVQSPDADPVADARLNAHLAAIGYEGGAGGSV